jgi:PhnB protein
MEYKPGTNVSLSLSGEDDEELTGYYDKLSEGGNASMPLSKAPWGDKFGMLTDKFGIQWLVNISAKKD